MIYRNFYINKINSGFSYNPIVVLLGARQVGKTTLMEMFIQDKKSLFLNGQNPETAQLFEIFSTIERYLKLNINENIDGWLVIDEFQFINGISLMLKLLTDKYKKLKILCSGSSSLNILQNINESLAGRVRMIPVYGLTFDEFLKFHNTELSEKFNKCETNENINLLFPEIPMLLKEFLTYGGLPKVVLAHKYEDKVELLNDIFQTYLLKDVKQFIKNKDFVAFNKLLRILSSQTGNLLNINELSRTIQLPYRTCEEYINILEQMFIIHLVSPFTTNKTKEISKMRKIYFCDIGLRNIVFNSFNDIDIRTDNGQIFENYVYLQLLKQYKPSQIFYYRTTDGTEIDFIIQDSADSIIPVEVKYKEFQNGKKIRALAEFRKHVEYKTAYIVNKSHIQQFDNLRFIQPYIIIFKD